MQERRHKQSARAQQKMSPLTHGKRAVYEGIELAEASSAAIVIQEPGLATYRT